MEVEKNEWSVFIIISVRRMPEKEYRTVPLKSKEYKTASLEAKEVMKDWKKRIEVYNKTTSRRYYNPKFYLENKLTKSWLL